MWTGSLSLGLVSIHFRMIHKVCNTPVKYCRVCELGEEVPLEEVAYGYRVEGNEYVVFDRQEMEAARPRSSRAIDLDAFVNFFEVGPHYVDKAYLLLPYGSEASYALLRRALQETGKAAIGRVTLRSRERAVLIR